MTRWLALRSLFLGGYLFTVVVACSGTGGADRECSVGSESCDCTAGGSCDDDLLCIDGKCERQSGGAGGQAQDDAGAQAGAGGASDGSGGAGAGGTPGGSGGSGASPAGTGGVPSGTGGTPSGTGGTPSGTGGTLGTGGSPGGSGGAQTVPPGPTVLCGYEGGTAASLIRFAGTGEDLHDVTFYGEGALRAIGGLDCEVDASRPGERTEFFCEDFYLCGDCQVRVMSSGDGAIGEGRFVGGGSFSGPGGTAGTGACSAVEGSYDVCIRQCAGKSCGDDACGGTCGTCPTDTDCYSGLCLSEPPCPLGCQSGSICCGGSLCGGDCEGSPCCS